jgi:hypothetical protein
VTWKPEERSLMDSPGVSPIKDQNSFSTNKKLRRRPKNQSIYNFNMSWLAQKAALKEKKSKELDKEKNSECTFSPKINNNFKKKRQNVNLEQVKP